MSNIAEIIVLMCFALLCLVLAQLIKSNRQRILQAVERLVQEAEEVIKGSGMGAEKKAYVIDRLEAGGVSVNQWLSAQIDIIVSALNAKGAWTAEKIAESVGSRVISNGGNC